jgi:hypothetical protein
MFSKLNEPLKRHLDRHLTGLIGLTVTASLVACTSAPCTPPADLPSSRTAAHPVVAAAPSQPAASCPERAPVPDATASLLSYAQQASGMSAAELAQEMSRLGNAVGPIEKIQLSLVLSQLHQLPELLRAQELLGRVLASTDPQAQSVQTMASLLAMRYAEQRRLSELLEKQTQQTREVQRRLDQTNDRLSALKAIERSLTNRPQPPVSPASAAGASHPASP